MPKKNKYFIDCGTGADDGVVLSLTPALEPLKTVLGYVSVDKDKEVPEGKSLIGNTKQEALENGCVPVVLSYFKGSKKMSAKVLCSPTKVDTIFKAAIGLAYGGGKVVKVFPVRRRVYTM